MICPKRVFFFLQVGQSIQLLSSATIARLLFVCIKQKSHVGELIAEIARTGRMKYLQQQQQQLLQQESATCIHTRDEIKTKKKKLAANCSMRFAVCTAIAVVHSATPSTFG